MAGKKSRDKGYRGENNLVNILKKHGIKARRVAYSGAGYEKGDILIGHSKDKAEVKVRKNAFKSIYSYLEKDNCKYAFIKTDYKPYLVVMRINDFIDHYKNKENNI